MVRQGGIALRYLFLSIQAQAQILADRSHPQDPRQSFGTSDMHLLLAHRPCVELSASTKALGLMVTRVQQQRPSVI
jgi:hypothetical protein